MADNFKDEKHILDMVKGITHSDKYGNKYGKKLECSDKESGSHANSKNAFKNWCTTENERPVVRTIRCKNGRFACQITNVATGITATGTGATKDAAKKEARSVYNAMRSKVKDQNNAEEGSCDPMSDIG